MILHYKYSKVSFKKKVFDHLFFITIILLNVLFFEWSFVNVYWHSVLKSANYKMSKMVAYGVK